MSKKIKALVQKYEKDMKFENRFDDLKHKLDLIPDVEAKSEVFVIKRKVMPAYVMMIVLLMLVTGLIGLQFGLNNDFVDRPEITDDIEINLMNMADIYEREAVANVIVDGYAKVYIYIGIENGQQIVIFYLRAFNPDTNLEIVVEDSNLLMNNDNKYASVIITNSDIEIVFKVLSSLNQVYEENFSIDLSQFFEYLGQ